MSSLGTDGQRGPEGVYPITSEGVYDLVGATVASGVINPGELAGVIGDPRLTTPQFMYAACTAFRSMGVDVLYLGTMTTPGGAWAAREAGAAGGLVVSASHNPVGENGFKLFGRHGGKLSDAQEDTIARLLPEKIHGDGDGRVYEAHAEWQAKYIDNLVGTAGVSLGGLHFVLDMARGAAAVDNVATTVFSRLGARVTAINNKPDGARINKDCGAEHTATLHAAMLAGEVPLGVAFDGDADRAMMAALAVENDQPLVRQVDGDGMLYAIARQSRLSGVVATIMTNSGLEAALGQSGTVMHRTDVGDRYVSEALVEHGLEVGAEQSGHLINTERLLMGDGIHSALLTMRNVLASGQELYQWAREIRDNTWPQALINVPVPDKDRAMNSPAVQEAFAAASAELEQYGGRAFCRPSGTQQVIRVSVERRGQLGNPEDEQAVRVVAERLSAVVAQAA